MEGRVHLIRLMKALGAGILLAALLLMGMAYVLYKTDFTGIVEQIMVVLIYLLPCVLGGWLMGRMEKQRKFLWGAILGVLFFLLLLLGVALSPGMEGGLDWGERLRVLMICMLGGMAGGMLG